MPVGSERLEALFQQEQAWEKIRDGTWSTDVIPGKTVVSKSFPGCVSQILKHFDSQGDHRATTHRILNPGTGEVPHHDEKDIHINGVVYYRQP